MMHSTEYGAVPAFLHKLWTLVEDDSTNDLITWDLSGKSFHVFDQSRFSKEVLPLYFKHSNIASFIRQLNMYGFRKVSNVEQGGLKVEKDDMEFSHPYFIRGEEHLLDKIKRKVTSGKVDDLKVKSDDVSKVLRDVHGIKGRQENISSKMENLERENEALWREVASLRQKHHKQQKIVNKLIQFLVTLVGNHSMNAGLKRKMPLMINDASQLETEPRPAKMARQYSVENLAGAPANIQIIPDSSLKIKEMVEPVSVQQVPTYRVVSAPTDTTSSQPQTIILVNPAQPATTQASNPAEVKEEMYVTSPPSVNQASPPDVTTDIDFTDVSDLFETPPDMGASNSSTDNIAFSDQPGLSSDNKTISAPTSTVTTVAIPEATKNVGNISDMSGELNSIDDSLDGLKGLLAGNVDPSSLGSLRLDTDTLLGLFTPEAPIPPTPESFLSWADEGKPSFTIDQPEENASGQMVQYNPTDDMWDLFDKDVVSPAGSDTDLLAFDKDQDVLNTPVALNVTSPLARRRKSKPTSHSTEDVD